MPVGIQVIRRKNSGVDGADVEFGMSLRGCYRFHGMGSAEND